jgi:hypothetical protein
MNVKELKALIADLPDDTPVLVATRDHEYCSDTIQVGTVLNGTDRYKSAFWVEDFGEDQTPEAQWGKRYQALLIGTP